MRAQGRHGHLPAQRLEREGGGGSRGGVPASPSPASATSAASCGSGTLRGGGEALLHPSCGIGMCGLDGGGGLQWWLRWC